jgi:hypothetical protein
VRIRLGPPYYGEEVAGNSSRYSSRPLPPVEGREHEWQCAGLVSQKVPVQARSGPPDRKVYGLATLY